MDQDVTWYRGRLGPGRIVLDRDPASPVERGIVPPTFRPLPIVAKRSLISATAELLFIFFTSCYSYRNGVGNTFEENYKFLLFQMC